MLNVIFGFPSKALRSVKGYISDFVKLSDIFIPNGGLPPTVVETEFAKKVILEIDRSIVHHARYIESPVLGTISFREISEGATSLIILNNVPEIVPLEFMGDNCFNLLVDIANRKDITVCTSSVREMFSHGFKEIHIVNDDIIVNNNLDFYDYYDKASDKYFGEYSMNNRIDYYEAYGIDIYGDLL